jgi:hypothetical protein
MMVGKKNIVFGFLLLVCTASLGPLMVFMYEDWGAANGEKQGVVGKLQALKAGDFSEDPETLEDLTAKQLAIANANSIIAMNKVGAIEFSIDYIKGGPHAHGNLEALLNIVVGIVLCFIAVPKLWKQVVSWVFIIGALMHGGLMIFERVFEMGWAATLVQTGIGPAFILLGLLSMGILTFIGFKGELVKD